MNEHEIERIAAAANALRPDWPVASLRTLLGRPELVSKPRRDVAVALTWVACDARTQTPARVIEAGPWWKAATVETPEVTAGPPRAADACEVCGRHELSCLCPDEERPMRNGGIWRPSQPAPPERAHNYAAKAREALRANKRQEDPA